MEDLKRLFKKYGLFLLLLFVLIIMAFIGFGKEKDAVQKDTEDGGSKTESDVYEKGYNLPVSGNDKKEAEEDCISVMGKMKDIYELAGKGDSINEVISEETAGKMMGTLKETGYPVSVSGFLFNMSNYDKMETFLEETLNGEKGEIITYELRSDGGIGRRKFIFDGTDMYVLDTGAVWNEENEPMITGTYYNRIKKWRYTKKGWFIFEYCVPEPPDVTEIVNGNTMVRVKPLKEEYIEIAKKYLLPVGYQGNNLLCANWDADHMEDIDYNGLYQYLYSIKYQGPFDSGQYPDGIPKEEFEDLIMEYLPISAAEVEQHAVFDIENQTYEWTMLSCGNYTPNAFGTSVPEIDDMEENEDGTVTLTIDAVCEMDGSDAVMSHKLTVQFLEDGNIRYVSNQVLDDGLDRIPEYQYRFGR